MDVEHALVHHDGRDIRSEILADESTAQIDAGPQWASHIPTATQRKWYRDVDGERRICAAEDLAKRRQRVVLPSARWNELRIKFVEEFQ